VIVICIYLLFKEPECDGTHQFNDCVNSGTELDRAYDLVMSWL